MRLLFPLLIVVLFLAGCRYESSCASAGRKEFEKQHPNYTILEIVPDGNADGVSYVAHYKKPNEDKIYFAYVSGEDNKTHKCEVGIREF